MVALRSVAAAVVLLVATGAGTGAMPSSSSFPSAAQSAYQRSFCQSLGSKAAVSSADATHQLLAAMSSDDGSANTSVFRRRLAQCCPSLANASAAQLLRLLDAEAKVAEITHNFGRGPASDGANNSLLSSLGWFPNIWASELAGWLSGNASDSAGVFNCMGAVETGLFGMRGFSAATPAWDRPGTGAMFGGQQIGWPGSLSEAADRPFYGMWNLWKQALPGRMYGDVAVVLRNSVVRDAVVTVPVDSGGWIQFCNFSFAQGARDEHCAKTQLPHTDHWQGKTVYHPACIGEQCCKCMDRPLPPANSSGHRPQCHRNMLCEWQNNTCIGSNYSAAATDTTIVQRPGPNGTHYNTTANNWWACSRGQCNCSAIHTAPTGSTLGTLQSWHHVLLQSTNFWTRRGAESVRWLSCKRLHCADWIATRPVL
jgi:hypothetical protein